ncbi:fimbrial protein [Salmonella enterica subsp. enterica serovar Poona]|uniref:Fimbrial protein n=1 Tax=Salmonella enterica TaxID=28901 RepID=A0A762BZ67_SALER|nr:hypothetical protein [Salmonella enterica]EBR0129406.1 fimbrial protein [Salmonella enterica subsp. enterica serovar Ajiobo]EBV2696146.1 fimbrial protein [Salmonella enterica subsp. enterica serovar Poona]EBW5539432.1 fimbrial protein [Salmonella enterica subsp. enterica serovar Pasing]EIB9772989.1 fimbrial protein [Salmonella enterica subsp. enterica serovar Limete]EBA1561081.1 fimbrial protein [Salmonella enterica]
MKKTLIALIVATSAVVSGSSMAWTGGDFNGSVDFGGTISPAPVKNPWEVSSGTAVTDLNYQISANTQKITIPVNKNIPVLGVRTIEAAFFNGASGLSPQISYNNFVDFSKASQGVGTLTLDVKNNDDDTKIGTMSVAFYAGAGYVSANNKDDSNVQQGSLYANAAGNAFFGGVPRSASMIDAEPWVTVATLNPEYVANFQNSNTSVGMFTPSKTSLNNKGLKYSAFYGAAIKSGASVNISLDRKPYAAINWKASLPVTVSYM